MYKNHSRLGGKSSENKKLVESVSDIESYYESRGASKQNHNNRRNRSPGDSRFKNAPVNNYRNKREYKNEVNLNNENSKFDTIHEAQESQSSNFISKFLSKFSTRFHNKTAVEIMKDPLVLSAMALMAFIAGISIGVAVLVKRTVKNLTLKN